MDIKIMDSIKFCHYEDEVFYKGVKSFVILYYKVLCKEYKIQFLIMHFEIFES